MAPLNDAPVRKNVWWVLDAGRGMSALAMQHCGRGHAIRSAGLLVHYSRLMTPGCGVL